MKTYRLTLHRNNILVGNLDCHGVAGEELIGKFEHILSTETGWSSTLWVSDSEKRILESSPEGIRLLSSEKIFRPSESQNAESKEK